MSWVKTGSSANGSNASLTSISVSATPVSVGDRIKVSVTMDLAGGGVTGAVVDDNLGNTYTLSKFVPDGGNQGLAIFDCPVTIAGSPSVRVRFTPTPGTTGAGALNVSVDAFSGSDASSVIDGTPNGQLQVGPGTGTDAVSSGSISTITDGDLIFAASINTSSGADVESVGTGFTLAQRNNAFVVTILTQYKVQAIHGSVSGTFTTSVGGAAYLTIVDAVTPGGGTPTTPPFIGASSKNISNNQIITNGGRR